MTPSSRARAEDLEHEVDEPGREPERHLVGDEQPRRCGEHAGQAEHLLLAARQRARRLRAAFREHGEQLERALDRAAPRSRARHRVAAAGRGGSR